MFACRTSRAKNRSPLASRISDLIKQAGTLEGLEIDLRNDLGGDSESAIKFVSLLLADPEHTVIYDSSSRDEPRSKANPSKASGGIPCFSTANTSMKVPPILWKIEIALLQNGSSASSSEISLGALKDNGRATSFGTRSFGKGVGFKTQRGPMGSMFRLSEMQYLTPSGFSPHHKGIDPTTSS